MALSAKQQRFVAEYLIDSNATAAARRAGYSAATADVQGPRLLGNVRIRTAIAEAQARIASKLEITAERTLLELARIAYSDPRKLYTERGELRRVPDMDDDAAATIASVEVEENYEGRGAERALIGYTRKVKQWDKVAALDKLGKHLKLFHEESEAKTIDWSRLGLSELETIRDGLVAAFGAERIGAGRNGNR